MTKYRLRDTSHQKVIYECEVEADSEAEAIKKADWIEISNDLEYNNIETLIEEGENDDKSKD